VLPFEAAIIFIQALIPFDGEDPAGPDAVGYAVDLIWDSGGEGEDSFTAAVCDVYRDGAEAALPNERSNGGSFTYRRQPPLPQAAVASRCQLMLCSSVRGFSICVLFLFQLKLSSK
jgi:hypothetical protein